MNRLLLWSPLLCDPLSTTRTDTAIHIAMNRTTLHILSAATSTTPTTSTSTTPTTLTGKSTFSPIHIVVNRSTLHILSAATSTTSDRHSFNFSNAHLDDVNYTRHKNYQLPWLDYTILKKAELRRLVRDHTSWQIVSQTCDKHCCV